MPVTLVEKKIEKFELSELAKEGKFQHESLAAGRWSELSLVEQMANIGSEVSRTIRARGDEKRFLGAVSRALELFDLTIGDLRWRKRLKEIVRTRELFCHAVCASNEYAITLEELDKYFYYFALAARLKR